jgi:hypothetical protein
MLTTMALFQLLWRVCFCLKFIQDVDLHMPLRGSFVQKKNYIFWTTLYEYHSEIYQKLKASS